MEVRCPYCGEKIYERPFCVTCNSDVRWAQNIAKKSKKYLIKGYQEAKKRNLTSASQYFKKAIYFNKYNTEARNLLGLVYFESGKISLALKEWIISCALDKEENRAEQYIKEIQDQPKKLETYKEAINLYNKALMYTRQNNSDVAIIRFKKAVGLSPNFIEARNLLTLCYIKDKQFYKANEQIKEVLRIDASNSKALNYAASLNKSDIENVKPYELEYIPKQSQKQIKPASLINRGQSLARYTFYFAVGVLCMFFIESGLIIPSKVQSYESQVEHLKARENELNTTLQAERTKSLEQITKLEEANKKLSNEKGALEVSSSKIAQKEKLREAEELKGSREWIKAADVIYSIAPSLLDEESQPEYTQLKSEVYSRAAKMLYNEAYNHFNKNDLVQAKSQFEKTIVYEPDASILRKSLYYLGTIEVAQGNKDQAKYYFNKVLSDYPDTREAYSCEKELKNLA